MVVVGFTPHQIKNPSIVQHIYREQYKQRKLKRDADDNALMEKEMDKDDIDDVVVCPMKKRRRTSKQMMQY